MLSRAAERMYWFGRYVERVENTARLIAVNTHLIMDLPPGATQVWESLISITGYEDAFNARFKRAEERNVVKFLLSDKQCSIRHAVAMARENARTSREILPTGAWEKINRLHLYLARRKDAGVKREGREAFLTDIINQCYEVNGYLEGSMSDDNAHQFIRIGRNLERADMTTRIVDVGCLNLMQPGESEGNEHDNILWMNVLRNLSAYQMYRQHVQDVVNGEDVVDFLLKDPRFPRTVVHCLAHVEEAFRDLPRAEVPLVAVTEALRRMKTEQVPELLQQGKLHQYIDEIQLELGSIHDRLGGTWFGYEPDSEVTA